MNVVEPVCVASRKIAASTWKFVCQTLLSFWVPSQSATASNIIFRTSRIFLIGVKVFVQRRESGKLLKQGIT